MTLMNRWKTSKIICKAAMKYLLDTHACLWAVSDRVKLSSKAVAVIDDPASEIFVSQISLVEIAIKHQVGKLPDFRTTIPTFIAAVGKVGFSLLPLKNEHIDSYFNCSFFDANHKDPFDRLLIATAYGEHMTFITRDEKFDHYKNVVTILW